MYSWSSSALSLLLVAFSILPDSGRSALMLPFGGMRRLPLDVLELLGKGRYLQLATVSREWRGLYARLFPERTTAAAAMAAVVPLLAWARDSGYELTADTAYLFAGGGHLEALQWARANGCPWSVWTCAAAAAGGHMRVLQWARANGCPWSEFTCMKAAYHGHLHVLQWLRANNCPWDARTHAAALRCGHQHVLQWAIDNGCPED
jgi:hypothetical protein